MREASDSWSDRWGLAACLLLAMAVRCLAISTRSSELTHDRDAYLGIARGVANGRGLCSPESAVPTAFRPPLYPSLLGLLMVALPMGVAVALVNVAAGVVTVWATFRVGLSLQLGRASLGAAALVAVDPLLLLYGTQPMTETVCTGLVALLLLAVVRGSESDQSSQVTGKSLLTHTNSMRKRERCATDFLAYASGWCGVSASPFQSQWSVGVLFGLLVLCRPTFWPLAGVVVAGCGASWVWNRIKQRRDQPQPSQETCFSNPPRQPASAASGREQRDSLADAAGYFSKRNPTEQVSSGLASSGRASLSSLRWRVIVGTLLVVAPWVIRNQLVIGSPLVTTTHGGYTLLLANNSVFYDEVVDQPWGTVWSGASLARWQAELDSRLERDLGAQASELERDRRQSEWGREFITAEPRRFVHAVWHRLRSLWSPVPLGETDAGVARVAVAVVGWFYAIELLAFVVGMVVVGMVVVARCRVEWPRWWILFALVITVQGVHLVYWTNARMRTPLTPIIALFAVAAVVTRAKPTR